MCQYSIRRCACGYRDPDDPDFTNFCEARITINNSADLGHSIRPSTATLERQCREYEVRDEPIYIDIICADCKNALEMAKKTREENDVLKKKEIVDKELVARQEMLDRTDDGNLMMQETERSGAELATQKKPLLKSESCYKTAVRNEAGEAS